MDFDNITDNNGYYQTTTNYGSNLALIGGILCTILTILLLLSKVSRINDNNSIITNLDTILKKMKRLIGVVLIVLIIAVILFCAPQYQIAQVHVDNQTYLLMHHQQVLMIIHLIVEYIDQI